MGAGDGSWGGRELAPDDPLGGGDDEGWQDLELDRDGVPTSSGTRDPTAVGGGRVLGDPFDGLDGGGGDVPGLELDTEAVRRSATHDSPGAPATTSSPGDLPVPDLPPSPSGPSSSAPVSRSFAPPREPSEAAGPHEPAPLPQAEVDALADYGPAPGSILGALPYAVLVFTRRRAVSRALADLRRLHRTAEEDAGEALVTLGRALHQRGDASELAPFRELLRAADEQGRVAGEKTQEWEQSRQVAETQRDSLQKKIEQAEQAAGPYRDRETKLATQMDVRETDLRRAKAKLQRVQIELRNLTASATPDPGRRQVLEAERDARKADVDKAQGRVDELAPQLAAARRELAVMLEAINDLEKQRRAVDQARDRTEKLHLSTAGEAEARYHDAVRELAEQALSRGVAEPVAPAETKAARMMITARDARAREIRLHEAALSAYDAPAFQKGAAIIAGAALVILAMLLFVVLR
ncbi:MAG TPA: hypothetical protein RMH99_31680 [Sandaracinaceae bacterium LLY-WYZ-13_1]|nr:hypothetical protein [Sandaracinaceae bacterium LLY-WYZ-13_1]